MEGQKRYVIRREDGNYYNGKDSFGYSPIFEGFNKAKVFKNVSGAKVACGHIYLHMKDKLSLEIVEIITIPTEYVIKYEPK